MDAVEYVQDAIEYVQLTAREVHSKSRLEFLAELDDPRPLVLRKAGEATWFREQELDELRNLMEA